MAALSSSARATYAGVKDIIETSLTQGQVNAFINAANVMVTTLLSDADLSVTTLQQIETWLAAHLLSTRDMRASDEAIGGYRVKYQGQTGLGLDATFYGQQVRLLDTSGKLANLGKQAASLLTYPY